MVEAEAITGPDQMVILPLELFARVIRAIHQCSDALSELFGG